MGRVRKGVVASRKGPGRPSKWGKVQLSEARKAEEHIRRLLVAALGALWTTLASAIPG